MSDLMIGHKPIRVCHLLNLNIPIPKHFRYKKPIPMKGIIFDVDGTLVNSYGLDGDCFRQAVYKTLGNIYIRNDWGDYSEVTDEGILREIFADNNLGFTDCQEVKSSFEVIIQDHLTQHPSSCTEITGAKKAIAALQKDQSKKIGIATGGWGNTARAKLNHVGIQYNRLTLTSCDDKISRIEIMDLCREKLECSPSDMTYIGDGEWDMQATEALGWNFIGIGQRLKNRCRCWYPDFSAPLVELF